MPGGGNGAPSKLALRGKSKEELGNLAETFLPDEGLREADKLRLVEALSREAGTNRELAAELGASEIAIKPSFYLMLFQPLGGEGVPEPGVALEGLRARLGSAAVAAEGRNGLPSRKGFAAEDVREVAEGVVEIWFTWQRFHGYWRPGDFSKTHVYEAQFGLAILDFNSRKAIIACHDRKERKELADAISEVYRLALTPMTLTQPLLDRIGDFGSVKRAGYFIADAVGEVPSNVSYADEDLSTFEVARTEESSFRSQRKHSFYRIPLGHLTETGIGATSDSGKLWIPREVSLSLVREYGVRLLGRITETLDELTGNDQIDAVLDVVGASRSPKMQAIRPAGLRREVDDLFVRLVSMIVAGENERAYTPSKALVTDGVPKLFNYPRLQLAGPDDGSDVAFWRNEEGDDEQVRVTASGESLSFVERHSKEGLDLSVLSHPITGETVELEEPLMALELVPKPELMRVLVEAVRRASAQIELLRRVDLLPFRISAGRLRLDLDRALGRTGPGHEDVLLDPAEIEELRPALARTVAAGDRQRLDTTLIRLGEKCPHMTDENCRTCVADKERMCLRSLVAHRFSSPLLLAHKGIERSDVQLPATLNGEAAKVFGFAKLGQPNKAKTKSSGLTARNENGAKLTAQVLAQARSSDFKVVAVVSPSPINEDLREQLTVLCAVFNKRLLVLDAPVLQQLLLEFENDAEFDADLNLEEVYETSGV